MVVVTVAETYDIRGDGKKRKFKPLSAVRKFFGKKKKKEDSVVAVKAQSTTALHSGYQDDDDDDGGFKSHQQPRSLAGHRSISEDSVFSPETKDAPIRTFPKSAVSEESLPKSAFQSELLSKLNKRKSQYSDDDQDDGLPRSPVPPVTTADVIMGGSLKPGPSGHKSSNRDSDQSLISLDSSDNEDELFSSKWKSSVSTRKPSAQTTSKQSSARMDALDFSKIQKTELLASSAAKDRISVKPKTRKATRQSRKTRDISSPQSLPSLNEESPTRVLPQDTKASITLASPVAKSPTKPAFTKSEEVLSPGLSLSQAPMAPLDKKPGQPVSSGSKPAVSSISVSSRGDKGFSKPSSPLQPTAAGPSKIVAVSAATAASAPPPKDPVSTLSPVSKVPPYKSGASSSASTPSSQLPSSLSTAAAGEEKKPVEGPTTNDKNQEKISSPSIANAAVSMRNSSQEGTDDDKPKVNVKSRMSQFQPPVSKSSTAETSASKTSELEMAVKLSPKTDNKFSRQARSRTLPGTTEPQTSPKIQRASSHRLPGTTSVSPEPAEAPDSPSKEKPTVASSASPAVFASVKSDHRVESSSKSSGPAWLNKVRKKKEESSTTENDASKTLASGSEKATVESSQIKPGINTGAPKSVFSSSSYLEKKRGSVETVSFKNRDLPDQNSKRNDMAFSDAKRQSIDYSSSKRPSIDVSPTKRDSIASSKRSSIDISSTRRESIEIDISELNSVKSMRSAIMKDSNKPNVPSNLPNSPSDNKAKPFFTTSATSGSGKSGSETSNDTNKPGTVSGGISHFRGGSVKTSPVKTPEVKSSFPGRAGSVKSSTAASAASMPSVLARADSKSDSSGASSSPQPSSIPDTTPAANPNLPSSTPAKPETSAATNIQVDKSSNRSSKVLDMVKNFQNLQVSS